MAKNNAGGLTTKHKIGYLMGDFGGCMTFAIMGAYATRYYVNVLGVDTRILAVMLAVWNIWDAVNDPMMGTLMDKLFAKSKHPKGKFRPWLLRATPLLAVTSVVFWTVPTWFEGASMLAVLFVCKILYEASYTMFNIPMGSLLSAMADDDRERAVLSSMRGFGSLIGNMIPLFIFPVFLSMYGDSDPQGYAIGSVICAAIGFVVCFLHYYLTEERTVPANASSSADDIKVTDIIGVFKKNRAFVALCIHGVCFCTMQYVGATLSSYMYADVLGDVGLMSTATVVSMPLSIVVFMIAPRLAEKFGLTKLLRHCLLIGIALYLSLFAVHMVMDVNPYVHMIWAALASGISGVSVSMQWGMVGEAIDYNELVTGKRTEGSIYGTFNLCRRIGQTIGNSAAVLALGWIGYNAEAAAQTVSTLLGIKALCVLVPGIFCVGSWVSFRFVWNITPEIRKKIALNKASKK